MDDITFIKFKRSLIFIVGVGLIGGLITWNVTRPSPEEQQVNNMVQSILSNAPKRNENLTDQEQQARQAQANMLRNEIEKLSPETRKKIMKEVARTRIQEIREQTSHMTYQEKEQEISKIIQQMQQNFKKLPIDEKNRVKERLNTQESKENIKEIMTFFHQELTLEEHKLMDPLLQEIFKNMQEITR